MRLQPGRVQNLDWLYEIRNNRAFTGGAAMGALAGNYSHVQIINPAGSGKTVIVRSALVSLSVTGQVQLRAFDTNLATAVGAGANLHLGQAASSSLIKREQNVALLGTFLREIDLLATTPLLFPGDWYATLDAGKGLLANAGNVNVAITAYFDWIEF